MQVREYNPREIEPKWQELWETNKVFQAADDYGRPRFYGLVEFPYPSGQGLHVGHPRSYTAIDIIARKRRLEGYNVLYPFGWDAFGLPTENFAIKHKIHPAIVTENNIAKFKRQLKSLGLSFDWSREINTTDPEYYRWTQWIFLKLFEKGLAYKAEIPINWCTDCKIGLANEEVVDGKCERCGGTVVKKVKSQWMLKITEYAQKLLEDLGLVDYIEKVRLQQQNWIGRSEGASIYFPIKDSTERLEVYSTRPDTLPEATYMVLAPEHPLLDKYQERIQNWPEIEQYRNAAATRSDLERTELNKTKTGVEVQGLRALNPFTGEELPLWISDYVLLSYGTGAIMAVPGGDSRDLEFAETFGLPVRQLAGAYDLPGMITWLEEHGYGKRTVNYRLRDWVFSRQRYWGEPIPLVYCESCGWVPVPETDLPVTLPEVDYFEPTDTGESPLAKIRDWVETRCPKCGGRGERETDTMPNWAGSSWYFLRYIDPHNDQELAAEEKLRYWLPIDWYNGGMEHTTLHLLYSRFWHKFLYDCGIVPTPEPYQKRTSHGMILAENNEKMSKSRGNVVNPDDVVAEVGADAFRVYEMFLGAFDQPIPWSTQGVKGCRRFLDRVWKLQEVLTPGESYSPEFEAAMHKTIKKVSADYESMKFNTAIAALMSLVNDLTAARSVNHAELRTLLILLNPVAPHMTEEIWQNAGFAGLLNSAAWPEWDEAKAVDELLQVAIQVNGKLRGAIEVAPGTPEEQVLELALAIDTVQKNLEGKTIVKKIFVQDKILNLVVK